jgi:hypothetical protein
MPTITPSATDLALLRRCFSAGRPKGDERPDDSGEDEPPPIPAGVADIAALILDAAWPGCPLAFGDATWEVFSLCCEIGADLLDENREDGLTDVQYETVTHLVSRKPADPNPRQRKASR